MTRAELPERIETERLVLRVRTVADAEDIYAYASLSEVSYPAGFPPVQTLEDEIYYLEHILPERNEQDNLPAGYGIVVKGTDTIIGSVDFNHRHEDDVLEIGYTLHPDYWGLHSVGALFVVMMMDVFSCRVFIRLKKAVASSFFTGKSIMSSIASRPACTIRL